MGKDNELSKLIGDFDAKYESRFVSATQENFDKREHVIYDFEGAHLIFEEDGEIVLYKDLPVRNPLEPVSGMNPILNPEIVITEPKQAYSLLKEYFNDLIVCRGNNLRTGMEGLEKYCNR